MRPDGTESGASPTPEDLIRFAHMLRASSDALQVVAGDDARTLAADMVRTHALIRCFIVIGEAATKLSPGARALLGDVPWRQVIGLRNMVVHVYWDIDLGILVDTTTSRLPSLVVALKSALATPPHDPPGP